MKRHSISAVTGKWNFCFNELPLQTRQTGSHFSNRFFSLSLSSPSPHLSSLPRHAATPSLKYHLLSFLPNHVSLLLLICVGIQILPFKKRKREGKEGRKEENLSGIITTLFLTQIFFGPPFPNQSVLSSSKNGQPCLFYGYWSF